MNFTHFKQKQGQKGKTESLQVKYNRVRVNEENMSQLEDTLIQTP